jgi:hypothetical protein
MQETECRRGKCRNRRLTSVPDANFIAQSANNIIRESNNLARSPRRCCELSDYFDAADAAICRGCEDRARFGSKVQYARRTRSVPIPSRHTPWDAAPAQPSRNSHRSADEPEVVSTELRISWRVISPFIMRFQALGPFL